MKPSLTYQQFLRSIAGYSIGDLEVFANDVSRHFHLFPKYRHSGIYIKPYSANHYIYANERFARLSELPLSQVKERGVASNEHKVYAPDKAIHHDTVFSANLEFFKTLPVEQHPNYLMSCNYRMVESSGALKNVLQESFFIKSTPDGMPLVTLGFITDISHVRNDDKICSALYNSAGEVRRDTYYSNGSGERLSPRHIEIIRLVCSGLLTKEIADKLHISEKTVDNHKQNIRKITNCRNVAEMVVYAMKNGYVD